MSINIALNHILFSKGTCVNVTKALIILFIILTASDVMRRENAAALLSSDLARVNNDHKFQTLSQIVLKNVSSFTSFFTPSDFAFFYSFGIIGETNNTVSTKYDVYIKQNESARPTSMTFTLSPEQKQSIWTSIIETDFFQIKNNFTRNCDVGAICKLVTPEHYYILKITGNNNTHTVIARDGYAFPEDEQYQKFKSLVSEIDRTVLAILPGENHNNAIPSNDQEPERGFL